MTSFTQLFPANPAIDVRGLTKSFGTTPVLRGVDFAVQAGSIFCLLGSNGAGKSTTIRILTTLLKPDGGNVSVMGYDVVRQARLVRQHIALTGQAATVDDLLTGRENLILAGELFHSPAPEHRADALLGQFGLTGAAERRAGAYSGGMRRRLDIAMGLTGTPDVIFLDEPTTGLDPQNRIEMWHIIDTLVADGATVFLTTQYLDEAERLAAHVAILHEGRIIAEGTPQDLRAKLPGSRITFTLSTPAALGEAVDRLTPWQPVADSVHMTVTISTDGSFADSAQAIGFLDGVGVASMEQSQVSLEDVFLNLVEPPHPAEA